MHKANRGPGFQSFCLEFATRVIKNFYGEAEEEPWI